MVHTIKGSSISTCIKWRFQWLHQQMRQSDILPSGMKHRFAQCWRYQQFPELSWLSLGNCTPLHKASVLTVLPGNSCQQVRIQSRPSCLVIWNNSKGPSHLKPILQNQLRTLLRLPSSGHSLLPNPAPLFLHKCSSLVLSNLKQKSVLGATSPSALTKVPRGVKNVQKS